MNQADKFTAEEVCFFSFFILINSTAFLKYKQFHWVNYVHLQVDQAFALAPIDPTGNIDYKSLCYIITHGDEKEES